MSALALHARALTKRYRDGARDVAAVKDVEIELPAQCLWVLSGPSGSGKSTLLGLLAGVIAPTSGEVQLGGQAFSRLREHHRTTLRRSQLGLVFQGLGLIDGMSVLENITLPCVPMGGPDLAHRQRAGELLERFGLSGLIAARAGTLSGGERQRAAIVRALILAPRVLILDEPTAHLDAAQAAELTTLLADLRDAGHAVLAATHDERLAGDARVDARLTLVDGSLGDPC